MQNQDKINDREFFGKVMNAESIIKSIEKEYLKSDLPVIHVGDTIKVGVKIIEGGK